VNNKSVAIPFIMSYPFSIAFLSGKKILPNPHDPSENKVDGLKTGEGSRIRYWITEFLYLSGRSHREHMLELPGNCKRKQGILA
jgi:hypothetical protein